MNVVLQYDSNVSNLTAEAGDEYVVTVKHSGRRTMTTGEVKAALLQAIALLSNKSPAIKEKKAIVRVDDCAVKKEVINVHSSVYGLLARLPAPAAAAWHRSLSQLSPKSRVQIVTVADENAASDLVLAGLIQPRVVRGAIVPKSYTISKSVAFCSLVEVRKINSEGTKGRAGE